ncbi:transposon Ty3-I Gag-Pol polyprotein [Trichonephila inaurata madagascariensis]|uniref:Transposon Ty3-I Gag-Pol polyprotein n=1 Tax=Trichonephila inaurata madagascariensis TaxID=2747483 RepID=A0A8X6MGG6_9ARAC|nr:transposon Ty3-I Gag-Pol polyprotein [Trichonephila inaurata madagascariensis]
MAFFLSKKKEDLIELAEELGLIVEAGLTKTKLKDLIVKSPGYLEEDVKVMFDSIMKDRIPRLKILAINSVPCILANKKSWEKEGFLNPIPKEDVPLSIYHVDFIGPLPSTNKRYQHILKIIDAFTKFTWLYPVKSTTLEDALDKLNLQQDFRQSKKNKTKALLLTPKDLTIVPKRTSKICRSPPAYPEGTVKWRESTEL